MKGFAFAVVTLTVLACGGSTEPSAISVVGAFRLQSINGISLPAVLSQTVNGKVEVLDDLFTLNADKTYSEVGHLRVTLSGGSVTTTPAADLGAYTSTNGAVQFVSTAGNGTSSGSVNGNTLTIIIQSATAVYVR